MACAAVKAPTVKVPTNFGLELLNSPSHGNLLFLLKNDQELRANSAIMSFNSPVMKKMTLEHGRTTIDVQDFSKEAVQCFLEASYSGSLQISKPIFRDVNKMAHVFEVKWLIDSAYEYFLSLIGEVKEDEFEYQHYVFEEAIYVLDKLKKKTFVDDVIKRFTSLKSCRDYFVRNYLTDLSSCSKLTLHVLIEMTRDQQHILVKTLIERMERSSLSQNSKYILENLNFATISGTHQQLCQEFFEKLENIENPSANDYKFLVKFVRQSTCSPKSKSNKKDLNSSGTSAGPSGSGINQEVSCKVKCTGPGHDKVQPLARFTDVHLGDLMIERNLTRNGYLEPTPIQKWALPIILSGKDLMLSGGSALGKTVAFILPIIINISSPRIIIHKFISDPEALVLVPTRDAAMKIYQEAVNLAQYTNCMIQLAHEGVPIRQQMSSIRSGCDILIGTPGRIKQLVNDGTIGLIMVRYFVLYEAETFLNFLNISEVELLAQSPRMPSIERRQNILISNNFPEKVQQIGRSFLRRDYLFLTVGTRNVDATQQISKEEEAEKSNIKRPRLG